MKTLAAVLSFCLLFAGILLAAPIDGKWLSVRKMERDGESFTITQTYDLKEEGGKLTGTVHTSFGEREMKAEIRDGKVEGSGFSFSTVMSTPNGEFKIDYKGTVEGDTLKGSAGREGGQSRPFEAKKQ